MRIGRRLRNVIAVVCACALFHGAALAQQRDETVSRGLSMVERGDCAGGWEALWPKARAGDAQAIASLAQAMRQYRLVPPGSSRDAVSWYRHTLIMSLHGLQTTDRIAADDVHSLMSRIFYLQDQFILRCLQSTSPPDACHGIAIDEHFVPRFEDYTKEIEALSAARAPAMCTTFGSRREVDDRYVVEYSAESWQFWEYDRERARTLFDSGQCLAAARLLWDWAAFGQPQAAIELFARFLNPTSAFDMPGDRASIWRHRLVIFAYALPGALNVENGDAEQRQNLRGVLQSGLRLSVPPTAAGHVFIECLEAGARLPEACLQSAVEAGVLPSPQRYADEFLGSLSRFRGTRNTDCK